MAVVLHKGWRGQDGRRYRIHWKAVDDVTGQVLACNEASFAKQPDKATEDAVFAGLVARIIAAQEERVTAKAAEKARADYIKAQGFESVDVLVDKCVEKDVDLKAATSDSLEGK